MEDTWRSQTVSTKLKQIAEHAIQRPDMTFTTLAHNIDEEFLKEAYRQTRKDAAAGVDEVTGKEYAKNLDANIRLLYQQMRSGRYKAPPVRRSWMDKEDNSKRPLGIPTFEDKILQRAVVMILEAIYEQSFYDFSYGFRKDRNPHQALRELREKCQGLETVWLLDVDIKGYFENIDHKYLREAIKEKVNDGVVIRFIGKWLNAGVMEEGRLTHIDKGVPQGGVISPMLSNIYLHKVLDDWYAREVKPRMKGRCFLIRYADDFVMGFEEEDDVYRVKEVLSKRFERYGLTIHSKKTKMIDFRKPDHGQDKGKGKSSFDFLGFRHYWSRSRKGNWIIKRKTKSRRLSRALRAIWLWCKYNRHMQLPLQYKKLCSKLRGHFQYYGIRGNYKSLEVYFEYTEKAWRHWLSRRCSKGCITWEKFDNKFRRIFPLPKPRIFHNV